MSDDDRNVLPPAARDAWTGAEPPDGFPERMVGLWEAQAAAAPVRARGVSRAWWLAPAAAVAVVLALMWPRSQDGRAAEGLLAPAARTEARLGTRAIAVVEAGASLSWQIGADGRATVNQTQGDVFYRVERGGEFVVKTAHGDVRVLGTCFRVEVMDMKKRHLIAAGAAGAALSAAILVTVYEGKVLLANPRGEVELAAGERGSVAAEGAAPGMVGADDPAAAAAAAALAPAFTAPAPDATREDLLARDEEQRKEIARLRQQVAAMGQQRVVKRGEERGESGDAFFNPTKEELLEMAENCELRMDAPSLDAAPEELDSKKAAELGLSETERVAVNRMYAAQHAQILAELRAIYVEVTGDEVGGEALAAQALMSEIPEKSREVDVKEAYYQLSHERAGLIPTPKDLENRPPAERFLRLMQRVGDDAEKGLAGIVGADRARAIRSRNGGWGHRWRSAMGSDCKPADAPKK